MTKLRFQTINQKAASQQKELLVQRESQKPIRNPHKKRKKSHYTEPKHRRR